MTLIVKEEVILVAVSHIKSVTVACRDSEESDSESNSESDNSSRARAQRQSSRGR